jgi:hypothetical protein
MREVADLWHRLAADADARAANPLRPLGVSESAMRLHKCARARISSGDIPVVLEETIAPLSQRGRECASALFAEAG